MVRTILNKEIILYNKAGTLSGVMFSISRLKTGHKTSFINMGLKLRNYYPCENLREINLRLEIGL